MIATYNYHEPLMMTLVMATLNIRSPLHYAVQGGLTRIVQCLLDYDTYMEGKGQQHIMTPKLNGFTVSCFTDRIGINNI